MGRERNFRRIGSHLFIIRDLVKREGIEHEHVKNGISQSCCAFIQFIQVDVDELPHRLVRDGFCNRLFYRLSEFQVRVSPSAKLSTLNSSDFFLCLSCRLILINMLGYQDCLFNIISSVKAMILIKNIIKKENLLRCLEKVMKKSIVTFFCLKYVSKFFLDTKTIFR